MQDLNDKVTGGTLTAAEWNEVPGEIQNVIEGTGQTLSGGDLNQLGKGLADYVANGTFYTDSGVADAYVLTVIGSKQSPTAYTSGLEVEFVVGNTNTGASTVNVATLGVVDIAATATAGTLTAGDIVRMRFNLSTGDFDIVNNTGATFADASETVKGIIELATQAETDAGADDLRAVTPLKLKTLRSGTVIQVVTAESAAFATTTLVMPFDNTIPQNTEGAQFLTTLFTPKFADSTLYIFLDAYISINTGIAAVGALFDEAGVNAFYATAVHQANLVDVPVGMKMHTSVPAVNTTERTYRFRAGPASAGTLTFNGAAGAGKFSITPAATITVMEVSA